MINNIAKKMRVAIGSNDGRTIIQDHMGSAKYFYIYDIFNNIKPKFIEKRRNSSEEESGEHGVLKKMKQVTEILEDVDVLISRKISPNFINISKKTKFQPIIIEIDSIYEIIEEVMKHFIEIYDLIKQKKTCNITWKIPKYSK